MHDHQNKLIKPQKNNKIVVIIFQIIVNILAYRLSSRIFFNQTESIIINHIIYNIAVLFFNIKTFPNGSLDKLQFPLKYQLLI